MEFEIRISNDTRALGLVEAFTTETLKHCPIEQSGALHQLVLEATSHLIAEAYPPGQSGNIVLHSRQFCDHVEISIRDFGLPSDIAALEAAMADSTSWIGHFQKPAAADAMRWSGYGPDGKALTITKSFHDTHITAHEADLEPFSERVERAPEQDYTIRRMRPADAVTISQLMYKAYGPTYFNRDVYYPERVAALNASESIISFVAEGARGQIVGHYALEKNQAGPVVEGGQAVVDPAHRGRHLLDQLKRAALNHARDLQLAGLYSDAVTVHRFTQKANIAAGEQLCCADVGISPRSEAFRGIAAPPSPQRVTCLMYFLPLAPLRPRVVHVPENHRLIVSKIYANIGAQMTFGESSAPLGHGVLQIQLHTGASTAFLTAPKIGADTLGAIRQARRELVERDHAEAVFVQLPTSDPATPSVIAGLESDGFGLAGIALNFLPDSDLVRLVYLTDPLSMDAMQLEEPFAEELVRHALTARA